MPSADVSRSDNIWLNLDPTAGSTMPATSVQLHHPTSDLPSMIKIIKMMKKSRFGA